MSQRCLLAALLISVLPTAPALADNPPLSDPAAGTWRVNTPTPAGRWVTPTHAAVIEFSPCGQGLCGRIVGMALTPGEPVPKDWEGKSQCGLTIVVVTPGVDGSGNRIWNGSVTDPRDGSVYHARLRLGDANDLLLRGYVGLPVFGQTQTWTKYAGSVAPSTCQLSGS